MVKVLFLLANEAPVIVESAWIFPLKFPSIAVKTPVFETKNLSPIDKVPPVIETSLAVTLPVLSTLKVLFPKLILPPLIVKLLALTLPSVDTKNSLLFPALIVVEDISEEVIVPDIFASVAVNIPLLSTLNFLLFVSIVLPVIVAPDIAKLDVTFPVNLPPVDSIVPSAKTLKYPFLLVNVAP